MFSPASDESIVRRYAAAVALAICAIALRWALFPVLGERLPFSTLFGFVALSVWYGGWAPGTLTAVLGYAAINWSIMAPPFSFHMEEKDVWGVVAYVSSVLVIIAIGEAARRTQRRTEVAATQALEQQQRLQAEIDERRRAEQALQRSEQQLSQFFEHASLGIHWVGPDGIILRANQTELDLLGYSREEYVGHHIGEFHVDSPVINDILHRLTRGETLREYPARLRCKDGSVRDVFINSNVLFEDGRFVHTRCFTRDVTDRKRAEEALQLSEARYRNLIEALPAAVYTCDAEGRVQLYNQAAVALWGREPVPQIDLWCGSWKIYRSDGVPLPLDECPMAITLREGRPVRGTEIIIERPDGSRRYVLPHPDPIHAASGKVVGAVNMLIDITERRQIDEQLRESEARTRAIFESALDALITMDAEGRIQEFNPAAEQTFGYSKSEAVGRTVAELIIPPSLRQRHREGLERFLATGEAAVLGRRIQMPALRADGIEILVECSIAVTRRPGVPPFFTAYLRDLSERVRSERATAHLAAIVRSSDDAIVSKDLKGIVASWNQAAERLFGYREEEMIGQPILKLIPPDRQDEERMILDKISRGETVETYETIRRRKDHTDVHVSITVSPLFDLQGRVIGASKIARDITERVQQHEILAQSRERLRQSLQYQEAVVGNMGDGLYTVNRQGLVVSMNHAAERMFGWTKDELLGRSMHELTHYKRPDGTPFPAEECAALEVLRSGTSIVNQEDVFIRKDGSCFDVVYSSSPIRSGDEITGLVVVFHDVTAQKRAEEVLKDRDRALTAANDELNQQKTGLAEANRELQSFSYSVSHDLRAPLRTIDAYVRIVEEDHGPDLNDEVRRCLGIVRKAAGQAGELIDDLLEFSRLGRIGMDFRPTRMTELAREVAAGLMLTENRETIDLTIGELPPCNGDWRLLKLVWSNLLSNAFKFTRGRELAQIEIGWLPDDRQADGCVYYVKDNGVGFDMKYVHKLFGVFQRLHLKDEFEGTGVGLAIVQRIVQRHGGRVWAEGKINGGATFFFSLRKAK